MLHLQVQHKFVDFIQIAYAQPICRRGFAFVEFYSADDAAEAHDKLDHAKLAGREIAIVFAKDKRKTPGEMRGGRDVGPRGKS